MNYQDILKLKPEEIKTLAIQHGLKPHHKAKPETIAKQIVDKITVRPDLKHAAQQPKPTAHINSEQEIREICAKFFAKEGYETSFKNDVWHFKFAGAEDSGHMSVPLRIIKMKAEMVSKGKRVPQMMNFDGDKIFAA